MSLWLATLKGHFVIDYDRLGGSGAHP